jgi:7-keto-8-aminopelargonate synthetase-like enzyme
MTFIFRNTGNETTAGELIWALRELARHPEKQQKLREEVSQIRGSEEPSYDDYSSKFPYLDAVVRETSVISFISIFLSELQSKGLYAGYGFIPRLPIPRESQ